MIAFKRHRRLYEPSVIHNIYTFLFVDMNRMNSASSLPMTIQTKSAASVFQIREQHYIIDCHIGLAYETDQSRSSISTNNNIYFISISG